MKHLFCVVLAGLMAILLASCSNVGVGGTISGGSNSGVNVGAGVNIHLYTEPTGK